MSATTAPFEYDEIAREVRSTDPGIEIIGSVREGSSEYRAYTVAIRQAGVTYCFRAQWDFLRDSNGDFVVSQQNVSAGTEYLEVELRAIYRDRETGKISQSTFDDSQSGRKQAADLATALLSKARMVPQLPVRRISFKPKFELVPQVVEL